MGSGNLPTVAICVSGVPRGDYCTEFIQRISLYNKVYVFVWYWNDLNHILAQHSRRGSTPQPFEPQIFSSIPGVIVNCASDSFAKYEPEFQKLKDQLPRFDCDRQDLGIYGMTFAIKKSNELREQYERENNMIFDCVIRARFEAKFIQPGSTNYSPYAKFFALDYDYTNKVYISCTNFDLKYGMGDCLAFSTSENMSKYSKVYDNINELSAIEGHTPEKIFYHNLKKYNLQKDTNQYILVGF